MILKSIILKFHKKLKNDILQISKAILFITVGAGVFSKIYRSKRIPSIYGFNWLEVQFQMFVRVYWLDGFIQVGWMLYWRESFTSAKNELYNLYSRHLGWLLNNDIPIG